LLIASAVLWFGSHNTGTQALGGMAFKAGLASGAAWLAFPQVTALATVLPPRLTFGIVAGVAVLCFRPRAFPLVLAAIAVLAVLEAAGWLLKPPRGRGPRTSAGERRRTGQDRR
jgi:hypothetical protein